MLDIQAITVSHTPNFSLQIKALCCQAGRMLAVLGQNGSGKSSLLQAIAGDHGTLVQIRAQGDILHRIPPRVRAARMAFLPQQNPMAFAFTAAEMVQLGTLPLSLNLSQQSELVGCYLQMFDLSALADQNYLHLSGGQQQRVQLARTLIQLHQAPQTPILLLDEPASAQDLKQQHQVYATLQRWVRERQAVCLMALHDLNHAIRYCDDAFILSKGQQVASGCIDQTLTASCIQKYWGYNTQAFEREGFRFFL